ncbi:hypothetical protein TNCV_3740871 [Trichonephila clavipes]|nr:hypothetical protein TNCV_3740871 [Trichonephila clavipes]
MNGTRAIGSQSLIYTHRQDQRQAFLSLEKEALRMGLKINDKYMSCTKSCFNNFCFKTKEYNFEVVDSFTYLGSEINSRNDSTTEIQKRITMANRCLNGI